MPKRVMIAAVGSNGARLVVWGLGRSRAAALRAAANHAELTCHEITAAQAARVRAGNVAWPIRTSGPTQPEAARTAKPLMLRLTPHVAGILRDRAAERGVTVSGLVSELVTRTWGHLYEATNDRSVDR